MNGWGVFALILVLVVVFGFGGWTIYRHLHARRHGLPAPPLNPFAKTRSSVPSTTYVPPAPAAGGIVGWAKSKIDALRNPRTSAGAYEATSYNRSQRRGFDALDPDEAWDSRVGNEADYVQGPRGPGSGPYYEEQELGLRDAGPYAGQGYDGVGVGGIEGRGRSRSRQRELDDRYDEEMGRANPFGDAAERSDLRGVSPRPVVERERSRDGRDRRSAFREDM
ncbi:hypothetical protein CAC42_3296 [Sphaceloma murrayae]|uniref:Uncharacterized protein n=1 Tax=Sphaceloma murrayae TaxID=2082308 RepID=A0A2K1QG04_9PEZI|nr:hypothetical protein CAC42_3296 [Sphaceloma murrayae]